MHALAPAGGAVASDELSSPQDLRAAASLNLRELVEDGVLRSWDDFEVVPDEAGGLLGKGSFAEVRLVRRGGYEYAVKKPLRPRSSLLGPAETQAQKLERFQAEARLLFNLRDKWHDWTGHTWEQPPFVKARAWLRARDLLRRCISP